MFGIVEREIIREGNKTRREWILGSVCVWYDAREDKKVGMEERQGNYSFPYLT